MGRIMGIDYGTKRVGVAVTDPLGIIAHGLTTLHPNELFDFLKQYFSREKVDAVVVGEPKGLDGKETDATLHANLFVKRLTGSFPQMKVERLDERFTSRLAKKAILASGLKKKQRKNKALVDEVSATILLQDYLEITK
ncbi:MAG: Holliday junction resolvase RuvX [Bacteroidia bacterium]|nr:Holliday junction resolvase RuvX [Bacteroidia bacterium]